MYKHWLQVRSNYRKTKSISLTLIIMFIISALLLNSGLLVISKYGNFYNQLKKELNPSDAYYMISDQLYSKKITNYLEKNEHIEDLQTNEMLLLSAEIYSKEVDKEKTFSILFQNMDEQRKLSKWKYVGDRAEKKTDKLSVYVPDVMKAISGYELNDTITLTYQDITTREEKTLDFIVKGYIEDIYFSSTDSGYLGFYLPEEGYERVLKILNQSDYKIHTVFTNVDNIDNISVIESEIINISGTSSSSFVATDQANMVFSIDLELIGMSRTMMATILSIIMVIFSLVIVIVCLLVVRFRIINNVEENLQKIGSLKSVGYTSKQIRFSIILQFLIISGIGSILGMILSYLVIPSISLVFEQQSGLLWQQGFDFVTSTITIVMLLIFVLLSSIFATKRISKLTPINAFRGESNEKKFKKNRKQLEYTRGPLFIALGLKTILQNIKQTIMITIIILAVSIAGAYGIILYYNTSVDSTTFAEVPGMEITNVIAILNPAIDQKSTIESIKNMKGIDRVLYFDEKKINVDGKDITTYIMEDYSKKQTQLVYEGKYPESDYEITLAGLTAERLNKTVGDTVTVSINGTEETFKIVGLTNGSSMGGQNASIRLSDMKRLNDHFQQQSLYIYLENDVDTTQFINLLNEKFDKETVISVVNFDKIMEEGMASYQDIICIMGVVMLVITVIVIALILYFMINSSIIKKRKELGIQKAIGYTTIQLMNQFSLEFIIPVLIGGIIGTIIGAYSFNPLMSMAMKSAGVMKANFIIDPIWITLFGIGIVLFSYLLSLAITLRIRKISAYRLVTE